MPRRVLVTGATGFIGRSLTSSLLAEGWQVRAAARDVSQLAAVPGMEAVALPDLAEAHDWHPLLSGVSHVVHLAGIAHATRSIPESRYMAVNCEATRTLAVAAREMGASHVVLMSSVRAQSGPCAEGILTEASPPRPTDAYGRSKLAAEAALADALAGSDTGWSVLRPVLVYGPGVKGNMASLVRLASLRLPLPLRSVRGRRSLLEIGSLASAVSHALESDAANRRVFLVADREPVTAAEIVAVLRAAAARPAGLFALPPPAIAAAARLAGARAAWQRLNSDLVVDASSLQQTGWQPCQNTDKALVSCLEASK